MQETILKYNSSVNTTSTSTLSTWMQKADQEWINWYHGMDIRTGNRKGELANKRDNENGILFLVEYYILKILLDSFTQTDAQTFETIVRSLQCRCPRGNPIPGLYDRGANESVTVPPEKRRTISHDNLTAISVMSRYLNLPFAQEIAQHGLRNQMRFDNVYPDHPRWRRFQHPRDWYFWLANGGYGWLAWIFYPFFFLNNVLTCFKPHQGHKISGRLLMFTRLELGSRWSILMRINKWVCYAIMTGRYGEHWLHEIMSKYNAFRNPLHPNRNLSQWIVSNGVWLKPVDREIFDSLPIENVTK